MGLLADAEFAGIRAALEVTLTHRCTITPQIVGSADSENNTPTVDGMPVTGVPCTFSTVSRVTRDEGGTTLVNVPSLTVSATATIAIGSKVTAITDQLGGTPPGAAGTFRVERVLDDTASLGTALLPVYELRAAGVS